MPANTPEQLQRAREVLARYGNDWSRLMRSTVPGDYGVVYLRSSPVEARQTASSVNGTASPVRR